MKLFLFFFLFLLSISTQCQQSFGVLELNNYRCGLSATGDLFYVEDNGDWQILGNIPIESDLWSIYNSCLWIGGMTSDSTIHLAAESFAHENIDWYNGPLTADGLSTTDNAVQSQFNRVWHASNEDVLTHISYFTALATGTVEEEFPFGYEIPEWMISWPAHGDTEQGFDSNLAPFIDTNGDGFYQATLGDYPAFCGDECLFLITNDKAGEHLSTEGEPMGVEIHIMLYAFDGTDDNEYSEMLYNTLFVKYKIINRSTEIYQDCFVGQWTDFAIGYNYDNYSGTNVNGSSYFAYNGDDFDEGNYMEDLPVQSVVILAGPNLESDGFDNPLPDEIYSSNTNSYGDFGWGFGNGIIDDERYGLSYTKFYFPTTNFIYSEPNSDQDHYYYLKGLWKDGSPVAYGEYDGDGNPSRYFAPGNSDPLHHTTGFEESWVWSEENVPSLMSDHRRMLGSSGPFEMQPDEINFFDVAFVFSRESDVDSLNVHETDILRTAQAKKYFNEYIVICGYNETILDMEELTPNDFSFVPYPNPCHDRITVNSNRNMQVTLLDMLGNVMSTYNIKIGLNQIDISGFSEGVYIIKTDESFAKITIEGS